MTRNEATQRIRNAWGSDNLASSDFSFAERIALACHALGLITLDGEPTPILASTYAGKQDIGPGMGEQEAGKGDQQAGKADQRLSGSGDALLALNWASVRNRD